MLDVFDPVLYSMQENRFLLEQMGKPPVVVMREVLPEGVNKAAVRPVIERVYELNELATHSGLEWVGIEAIKVAINTYIEQATKWANDTRKGRQRFPSMFSYDSRGRGHRGAPGSDSGQVRTYFDNAGQRQPFAIDLVLSSEEAWVAPTLADLPSRGLVVNNEHHRIECQVCSHTESFNADARGSFNAARARMSKHLRTATEEVDRHREVYTEEFR